MLKLEVLYEDKHLIAINKRSGDLVQGDKTGDISLNERVKTFLKEKYNKPGNVFCGVIHRIDRPVSGVVLFAKTSKSLSRMNQLVKERNIEKIYWGITQNKPEKEEDTLINYLHKNERTNTSYVSDIEKKNYLKSELHYKIISKSKCHYLFEIQLITGRHHQIRAQLSHIGCPLKGDLKYGAARSNSDGSICLHSYSIAFVHPISHENICITAPIPDNRPWIFFAGSNL